jgi:hypothetical protein
MLLLLLLTPSFLMIPICNEYSLSRVFLRAACCVLRVRLYAHAFPVACGLWRKNGWTQWNSAQWSIHTLHTLHASGCASTSLIRQQWRPTDCKIDQTRTHARTHTQVIIFGGLTYNTSSPEPTDSYVLTNDVHYFRYYVGGEVGVQQ